LLEHLRAAMQLPELQARWYVAEIAGALDWLHAAGWLYRDLKLTNIMVSLSTESFGRVKLIDYGFALQGTACDKAVGTLRTMAPEVICCTDAQWLVHLELLYPSPRQEYGPSADWWSLGVVLYELLTGEPPFGYQDDLVLEGLQVLTAQLSGLPWPETCTASVAAKAAANSLCCLDPSARPRGMEQLRHFDFLAGVDWAAIASTTAPGPAFDASLGHTAATAAADPCRPRRGALPVGLEEPDPFADW